MKMILCAATLAATLGMAVDASAGVGEPFGTYDISGRNYGDNGASYDFGAGLLLATEGGLTPGFTADNQLTGAGTPETFAFDGDGTEKLVNGVAISESYAVYDPALTASGFGVTGSAKHVDAPLDSPWGDGDGFGLFDVPIKDWETPGHIMEIRIRDTNGTGNDDPAGGISRDVFGQSVIRVDGVIFDGTTPSGGTAVPYFVGDHKPYDVGEWNPPGSPSGDTTGFYADQQQPFFWYYELDGAPAVPSDIIQLEDGGDDILQGPHPITGGADHVFYPVFSVGDVDQALTHDIGDGTMSFSVDTSVFGLPFNMVGFADFLNLDSFEDIDTIVFGFKYIMIAEGDGDLNGKVDGLDYLLWASNFGTDPVLDDGSIDDIPGGLGFNVQQGDFDKSGAVDGLDYLKWAANFGFVGDGSDTLATAVPEPGTLALACFGLAGMGLSVRRRRQS